MFKDGCLAIVLGIILASGRGASAANASAPSSHPPETHPPGGVAVDGVNLEWRATLPELTPLPDGAVSVYIPGYAQSDAPSLPQLPITTTLLALPAGARPTLEIIAIEETDLPLTGVLRRAPRPAGVLRDAAGDIVGGAYAEDGEMACSETAGCPDPVDPPLTLTPIGALRGVPLARLAFSPVRPVAGRLRVSTYLRVFVRFNVAGSPTLAPISPESAPADSLLAILKRSVINPEQVRPAPAASVSMARPQGASPRALVSANQPGLTELTYASLVAIGFPLAGVDPQRLRLTRAGVEIALQWDGNPNASFEPSERLLFYAAPRFSRWTSEDVYTLSVGDLPGLRMASRPANPAPQPPGIAWMAQTYEINALYMPVCYCGRMPLGRDGDPWTWDDVRQPDRAHPVYTIGGLPALNTTQAATLTLWLISYTDLPDVAPDHRVDVSLNGRGLGQIAWDGQRAITASLVITPGVLIGANNALSLSLPGVGSIVEGMWLDAFALRYARNADAAGSSLAFAGDAAPRAYTLGLTETSGLRGYDVTNPEAPISLAGLNAAPLLLTDPSSGGGRSYLLTSAAAIQAPSRLRLVAERQPVSGADEIILSPAAFMPALTDLIALRQSQGLTVVVEDLQAVYDAFDGRPTPEAIRAYLQDAYAGWNPRPTYVLLVGDGNYDPKRYRASSKETLLPPYLADVDPWMGETAADNRYALLDGDPDILPDVLIGRLPVNTITETQTVVDKIVRYQMNPEPGAWSGTIGLVADDSDEGGDFAADAAHIAAAHVPPPLVVRAIYYAPPITTVPATQQAILARWNAGAGVIFYTGHSSVRQWAAERLFHRDDVAALRNGRRLPVVLEMTCFTGFFHEPNGTTLDETLVRAAEGGAVAVWGASGLGVAAGHQQLAEGFLDSLYQRHEGTLGAGTLSGRLKLVASGSSALDLVDTFNLLGDPATRLNASPVTWAKTWFLPAIWR